MLQSLPQLPSGLNRREPESDYLLAFELQLSMNQNLFILRSSFHLPPSNLKVLSPMSAYFDGPPSFFPGAAPAAHAAHATHAAHAAPAAPAPAPAAEPASGSSALPRELTPVVPQQVPWPFRSILTYGGFPKWGYPKMDGLLWIYNGKSHWNLQKIAGSGSSQVHIPLPRNDRFQVGSAKPNWTSFIFHNV